jgi:hypothetical protein
MELRYGPEARMRASHDLQNFGVERPVMKALIS